MQSKLSTDKDKKYHESRIVKKGSSSVGSEPHEKKKQRKESIRNRSDFLEEDDEDLEIDPFSNNRKSNNAGLGGSARPLFSRENIRSDYFEGHHRERSTPAVITSSSQLQSQRRPTPAVITSSSSSSYGGVPVLANTNSFV